MASAWLCRITYAAALAAALALLGLASAALPPLWLALLADVAATLVVFLGSLAADNASVYDPYWSLAPPLLCLCLKHASGGLFGAWHARQALVVALVLVWAARFHVQLPWAGWTRGLAHEDWRYSDWRPKLRKRTTYWAFALLSLHLTPTLLVFLALAPASLVALASTQRGLGWLDVVGALIGGAAIAIEAVADAQLHAFRKTDAYAQGAPCERGLWAWSRHPNYFGEVLFWLSLLVVGLSSGLLASYPWMPVGAIAMYALIRYASVPMMDERSLALRPGYDVLMKEVSALMLWPRMSSS
ncbi:hypothetical protein AB1Y20_013508 [Prymnesium parvum]|uniref:Steroid 5-alpha reductase C-terminal domain-containing protein n=1 Tax=Prymnesium parvum TaxID=97485 RepID=A0AB34IHY8_PRYPA